MQIAAKPARRIELPNKLLVPGDVIVLTAKLNEEGLRVVAVAMKEMPPHKETYGVADELELTFIGPDSPGRTRRASCASSGPTVTWSVSWATASQ